MSTAGFISIIIILLIILLSLRKNTDIFSPGRIFAFTWSMAIFLTEFKFSKFQDEWSVTSWILVLLGPASLLLGVFGAYVLNLNKKMVPIDDMRTLFGEIPVNTKRLFNLIIFSFLIYVFSYLSTYLIRGYVPLFSIKGASSRTEFGVFGLGILIHSMPFILFFTVFYFIKSQRKFMRKGILIIVCIITTITYLFLLQRFQFIMMAMMCIVLLYYMTRKINFSNGFIITLLVLGFFYWVSTVRTGQLLQDYLYSQSRMKFGRQFSVLTEPYMYLVMNLENLARAVERNENFTYGYYTFDFIFALSGLKHWIGEYYSLDATPFLNCSYNTYTAFWTYYRDFGVIGLLVVPLSIGYGVSALYYSMRRRPTLIKLSIYCMAVFVLVISFFNHPLGYLWYIYNMVMVFYLSSAIVKKPTDIN